MLIGETARNGHKARLGERDLARHLYIIGSTGTGKSTLLANMIKEDIRNGKGVILFDPHGDLWDELRKYAISIGREDLVLAHLADKRWHFTCNILAGHGGNPYIERNTVVNGLIDLVRKLLYSGVPEAFGPMFMFYFRTALLMIMDVHGDEANIMDFPRFFSNLENVPQNSADGKPVGLQLIGPPRGEAKLLAVARTIEQAVEFPKGPIDPVRKH